MPVLRSPLRKSIRGSVYGSLKGKWAAAAGASYPNLAAPKYIIDSDFTGDPDDALAMAVALQAHKAGTINLIGIVISSTTATAAPAMYGLLKVYACDAIPVYAYQGATGTYNNTYTTQVRDRFGIAAQTRTAYTNDLTGYRTLLAANSNVTIVGIGAPVALSRLLSSAADGISALTGAQLIVASVSRAIQMAGAFPGPAAAEYNATRDIASTQNVATNWPSTVPFMWTGSEVGLPVYSTVPSDADPLVDPIRYAFDVSSAGGYISAAGRRSSWDPIAVHYAIYGLGSLYSVGGANGSVAVDGTGVTTWSATAGPHSYLAKVATDDRIGNALDLIVDSFIMGTRPTVSNFIFSLNEGTGQVITADAGNIKGVLGSMDVTESVDPTWSDQGTSQWGLTLTTGKVVTIAPNDGFEGANMVGGGVIKMTAVTGTQMVIAMYDLGPNAKFMFRNNAGKLNFIGYTAADGTTNFNVSSAAVVLTAGAWAMCTFEIIGTALTMYVGGTQVYSGTVSGALYVPGTRRILRPTLFSRFNSNGISDSLGGVGLCGGLKVGASAGDHVALEASLRAIAAAKGITV